MQVSMEATKVGVQTTQGIGIFMRKNPTQKAQAAKFAGRQSKTLNLVPQSHSRINGRRWPSRSNRVCAQIGTVPRFVPLNTQRSYLDEYIRLTLVAISICRHYL